MQGQDELGRNWFPGSRKAPTPLGAIERGIAPGNLCHEEGKKNQNEKEKNTEVHAAINVYQELHGEGYFEGLLLFLLTILKVYSFSTSSPFSSSP